MLPAEWLRRMRYMLFYEVVEQHVLEWFSHAQ